MKVEEKQAEDLVVAAVNDALSKAQTHLEEQTQQAMGACHYRRDLNCLFDLALFAGAYKLALKLVL